MTCTFFGHSDAPDSLKETLYREISMLIENGDVKKFYVGNNGNYDFLVQVVLARLSRNRGDFEFSIVLSFPDEKALSNNQRDTVFVEGLEKALPRFAISKRNEWLIKNSDFAIVYLKHGFSNCSKWVQKARKKGLRIISISD